MYPSYVRESKPYPTLWHAIQVGPVRWNPTIEYGVGRSSAVRDGIHLGYQMGESPERCTVVHGVRAVYGPIPEFEPLEKTSLPRLLEDWLNLVREWWNPKKKHLIPHSSGLDSRAMSATLRYLADREGKDWLGDTTFITWAPEGEVTRPILDSIGFGERHRILVHDEGVDTYAQELEPRFVARHCGEPDRFFPGLYRLAEDILTDDVRGEYQVLTGCALHPAALWKRHKGDLATRYASSAWGMHDAFWGTDVLYSWNHPRILRHGLHPWKEDERPWLINQLVPSYGRFENYSPQKRHPNPCYDISEKTLKRLQRFYNGSRYVKDFKGPAVELPVNLVPGMYPPEWAHYQLACLIEYGEQR